MAKKNAEAALATIPESPTCIYLSKEQAKGFSVGESVRVVLEGTVKGITEDYGSEGRYRLELKPSKVVSTDSTKNAADKEIVRWTGKDKK